jgi:flagellar hook-associated protein 1 FlgK
MSGLGSVLLSGLSALRASQTGMGVASQNIANANTPGYVRAELTISPSSAGSGVEIGDVRRAADRFLATASFIAEASNGAASARADILSRAQASFGDPTGDTSMFAALDRFWAGLAEISVDPSSTLRRDDAVSALQETFAEVRRVGDAIQSLISEADQRIGEAVTEAQNLMERIASLNDEIRLTARSGADATGAENAQSALIDKLSAIMDVRVSPLTEGGVHVRSSGGALLVGVEAAQLSYTPNTAPFATHGVISFNAELGTQSNIEPFLLGGQLAGLLQVRDEDLAGLAEAVGGFAGALSDTLNEVHNANASTPAVGEMVGRQTGLLGSDALGFTGNAVVGVVDSSGNLAQRLTIDFDAGTITGEAPAAVYNIGATITSFTNALDFALGAATPAGGADFTGGVLSLDVGAGGGLVVQQDEADPSMRAGRGFSHFFGLNDLISRPTPSFFESGVDAADRHGLAAGGELVFQVRDAAGRFIADRTIAITGALAAPGSTWGNVATALNAVGGGLGGYATVALDATTGRMTLTAASGFEVKLLNDSTSRGATGVSASALHGLSSVSTAGRALEVDVNDLVAADPGRLAVARPDLSVAIGDHVIESGDNRGAAALAEARDTSRTFPAAGVLLSQTTSLSLYSARLGGEAGRLASDAQRRADGAEAVATAAADRRAQIEGVSLDDELIRMTTFQNSYAAAARVIQAATEMLDILLAMGIR